MCTTYANRLVAEAAAKRLRLKRHKGMLRERDGLSAVDVFAVTSSCDAFARHSRLSARLLLVFVATPSWPPVLERKPLTGPAPPQLRKSPACSRLLFHLAQPQFRHARS